MTDARGFDLKVFGPFCAMWEPFITALDRREDGEQKAAASASVAKVQDSASAVLKAALRAELEVMALASRRAQAIIHLPVELMTARNPQDYFERATGFYETAYEQYSKSSIKVMSIWGEMAECVCADAQKTRDYIDFSKVQEAEPQRRETEERPRHRRAA